MHSRLYHFIGTVLLITAACSRSKGADLSSTYGAAPPKEDGPGIMYWGATVKAVDVGAPSDPPWDMRGITEFERRVGARMSILHFGAPWYAPHLQNDNGYYPFPEEAMNNAWNAGYIILLDWASWDYTQSLTDQPKFKLATITRGDHDAFLRKFAQAVKRWGKPFMLRLNWEMNGDWFPWGVYTNGNKIEDYIPAWRHVHDIFTQEGTTNVTWVWCPNTLYQETNYEDYYPGDSYVDWTCTDIYNFGTDPAGNRQGWKSFTDIFQKTYDALVSIAPAKPIVIAESGCTEKGGSKAAWTTATLGTEVFNFPQLKGYVMFNQIYAGLDWRIESSQAALLAFREGIRSSRFVKAIETEKLKSPIPTPEKLNSNDR